MRRRGAVRRPPVPSSGVARRSACIYTYCKIVGLPDRTSSGVGARSSETTVRQRCAWAACLPVQASSYGLDALAYARFFEASDVPDGCGCRSISGIAGMTARGSFCKRFRAKYAPASAVPDDARLVIINSGGMPFISGPRVRFVSGERWNQRRPLVARQASFATRLAPPTLQGCPVM